MKRIVAYNTDIRSYVNEIGTVFEMKDRYCNAICFSTSEAENVFTTDNGEHVLRGGRVLFIPKGMSYEMNTTKTGIVGLVNFSGVLPVENMLIKEISNAEKMWEMFISMENEKNEYIQMSKLYELLDYIDCNEVFENDGIISRQLEYINKNYCDPRITNSSLAKMSNISEVYFRKIFVKTMGISPHLYLMNLRLNNAKQLLKDGRMTVAEIAESSGFSSVYYFSSAFKKYEGVSPKKYADRFKLI